MTSRWVWSALVCGTIASACVTPDEATGEEQSASNGADSTDAPGDPAWMLVGAADLNGDRSPDLLWWNQQTGEILYWLMNGATAAGPVMFPQQPSGSGVAGAPWMLVGAADLDGDSDADLLWWNRHTGEISYWLMEHMTAVGMAMFPQQPSGSGAPGAPWMLIGATDLDRNGTPDLMWWNRHSGEIAYWAMNGVSAVGMAMFAQQPSGSGVLGAPWMLTGAADIDRDGNSDLLWWNRDTGEISYWLMNGATAFDMRMFATQPAGAGTTGAPWMLVEGADLDVNGSADLYWWHRTEGVISYWLMDGGAPLDTRMFSHQPPGRGAIVPGSFAAITDLYAHAAYFPPVQVSYEIPDRTIEVRIDAAGGYRATHDGMLVAFGANFMNDVLQPALDYVHSLGGGVVHLRAKRGRSYHLEGASARRASSGQNLEIQMFDRTAIIGDTYADGSPATEVSIDSPMGNVFGCRYCSYLVVANLAIRANHYGNYVVSNYSASYTLTRNVTIDDPQQSAFGHISGRHNWYIDDTVFSHGGRDGGHGFSVGGNQLAVDPASQQDDGTTIINGVATGYYNTQFTCEGILLRPVWENAGANPNLANTHVRIIGGTYAVNVDGVALNDASDPLVVDVSSHDNSRYNFYSAYPQYVPMRGQFTSW